MKLKNGNKFGIMAGEMSEVAIRRELRVAVLMCKAYGRNKRSRLNLFFEEIVEGDRDSLGSELARERTVGMSPLKRMHTFEDT